MLGRVHHAKKRREKARECIAEAAAIFAETEATLFLQQAREALAALE